MEVLWIVIAVLAALAVLHGLVSLAVVLAADRMMFSKRYDKNPLLRYYSADDFSLGTIPVQTTVNGTIIRGYIYSILPLEQCGTLIIFAHGMGPGQCAYTTEIAYLCRNGCAVLAFDSMGCNMSDGKNAVGLEAGTACLAAAVEFAENDSRLSSKKKVLMGHSMGAYAALCAAAFKRVDGVVALSAPESYAKVFSSQAKAVLKKGANFICAAPWIYLISKANSGKYAAIKASEAIEKSGAKALIIHGGRDAVVDLKASAYYHARGQNVTKVLCEGKGHNPYNTAEAEKQLAVLQAGLARCKSMSEGERGQFFSSLDYAAICEEDPAVMSQITEFINNL